MAPNHLVDSGDEDTADYSLAFKVNAQFADKYDTKKRTEELSKLQDKYGKDYQLGDDDDDDETDYSTDDDDAELVTPEVDAAILRTLAKIRARDPTVYEDGRNVFDEEEAATVAVRGAASTSRSSTKASSSSKPVLLKDYQRARLLANPEGDEALDAADGPQTHAEEQRALKQEITAAFHADSDDDDAAAESEDDDGLFRRREKDDDERAREEREYERFLETAVGKKAVKQALGEDKEEAFLRSYILNRGWIDRENDASHVPSYDEIVGESTASSSKKGKARAPASADGGDEFDADGHPLNPAAHDDVDAEFDDKAEEFETRYNFRYEEAGAADLVTHARDAASSVRKPTTVVSARARAREAAKQRKEEEALQRKEELRRLKALKRKEVEERLKQIVEAAGAGVQGIEEIDLDGEWDEAKHEEAMRKVYGDEYEAVEDDDFKPTWDDDIDITDLVGSGDEDDVELPYEPVASTSALPDGQDVDMDAEADETAPKKSKKERKKEKKAKRDEEGLPTELLETVKATGGADKAELVDRLVDEYYALDYEDKVGDLRTRFKYAKVAPTSFNLTPEEILLATDAELNAFMSLKKIAPYRQDSASWQAKEAQKQRKKLKELREILRTRKWGEEIDEEQAQKALEKRREKKKRYRDNAEKRNAEAAGADGGEGGAAARGDDGEPPKKKKRAGRSERKRLQKEKATGGEAE